jgi:hypothetical protein
MSTTATVIAVLYLSVVLALVAASGGYRGP